MARMAAMAFFVVTLGAGCYPRAETDLGRFVVRHDAQDALFGWSSDNTTLYWIGPNAVGHFGLEGVDVQTGGETSVMEGHDYAHSLTVTAQDRLLYFIGDAPSPDRYVAGVLYQAPLADHRAGTAVPVATNVSQYSVSLDGVRLAVVDATTLEMSTIDLATGFRRSFGKVSLGSFSPDGTRLAYAVTSASGTSAVYLADPITGASEPYDPRGWIIAWDGGTPRKILQFAPNQVVDLVTGETQPLPETIRMIQAYSGDPAALTMGYYSWVECLYETVAEDGVTECGESQGLLYRVDLRNGGIDVVATYNGRGNMHFAVSQDGTRLAVDYLLNDPYLPLFVKELAQP